MCTTIILESSQGWKTAALTIPYCVCFFKYCYIEVFMDDFKYMRMAIEQAKIAYSLDEVPVGAVIVKDDKVISVGYNRREIDNNAIKHAEIIAIEKACSVLDSWRLDGCVLYVTLEPCMMCMGAIIESRISKVVYGAKKVNNYFLGNNFQIFGGVAEDVCLDLLQSFFKEKR